MTKQISPAWRNGSLLKMLKVDMRRAVCSPRFLFGVLMMLVCMTANIYNELHNTVTAPYLLWMAVTGDMYIGPVILVLATVPYSSSYIKERECGFQRQAVERVGLSAYSVSKVLTTALSAFLLAVVAMGVFLTTLCVMRLPHTTHTMHPGDPFALINKPMGPFLYYGAWFILIGLKSSLCAVFALLVTCWLPNAYVCLLAPMITYSVLGTICYSLEASVQTMLPVLSYVLNLFNPDTTFNFVIISNNVWFTVLWPATVFLTETVLCGWVFVRKLRKGQMI